MAGAQDIPLHESIKDGVMVNCVHLTGLSGAQIAGKTFFLGMSIWTFSEKINVCIYRLREAGGLHQ